METAYVEKLDGGYRLSGTRVSLDSIVLAFWRGETAEIIAQAFPSVPLEQIYGALAYYLAHRSEVDVNLAQADAEFAALRDEARRRDPMFFQRMADARRRAA